MSAVVRQATPSLRPMREEDIPAVMEVELRNYPFPWTEGIMRDCLQARYSCWVYELSDSVIGYGILSVGAGEAHILNISVDPEFQGCGLGREMLAHLLERARTFGADVAFLEVRPSNQVALRLYESIGFNQAGVRRNYYPAAKGREDALLMALVL